MPVWNELPPVRLGPSNGMHTSNRMTDHWSDDMMVKSGLLAPVVLGRAIPPSTRDGGMARITRSSTVLCLSLTMPKLWWQ